MQCLARGIPIITVDYINSCVAARKIIPPTIENTVNTVPMKFDDTGLSDIAVLNTAANMEVSSTVSSPFERIGVYFVGEFRRGPKKEELIGLAEDMRFKIVEVDWKAAKIISQKVR